MLRAPTIGIVLVGLVLGMGSTAQARNGFLTDWIATYPNSTSDDEVVTATGKACQLCHSDVNGGNGWNEYGWALRLELVGGASQLQALANVEPFDSDLDPTQSSDLKEITFGNQPGWTPGPVNTIYFSSGPPTLSTFPPPIPFLDPNPLLDVPTLGFAGGALLGLGLLGLVARRRRRS